VYPQETSEQPVNVAVDNGCPDAVRHGAYCAGRIAAYAVDLFFELEGVVGEPT
jgi:hypothetical protein